MQMQMNKTTMPKQDEIQRQWHLIDADGKVLGRMATQIATILRGKDKTLFMPSVDCGDFVVVTNASKMVLTGNKLEQKMHFRHSGQPGGGTLTPYVKLMAEKPELVVELAVKGMLPKNKLRDRQLKRLKIFSGAEHTHAAQFANIKPIPVVDEKKA